MTNNITKQWMVGKSLVSVGRFTYGYKNLAVMQWDEGAALTIGGFCSIATNVTVVLGGNHRVDWVTTFPFGHIFQNELGGVCIKGHPTTKGDVVIGHDVWIGHGVTILSGVTIGDGAVLSTHANVVKDVAPYEIVGGNPAKTLSSRFEPEIVDLLLKLKWWTLPVETIRAIAPQLSTAPSKAMLQELIFKYRTLSKHT